MNLLTGQQFPLRRNDGTELGTIRMGLGWDPVYVAGTAHEVDLDASALLFAGDGIVDVSFYGQLISRDGSVRHRGDNLTGEGDGDDEIIIVDLTRVPEYVTSIVFVVTSYGGHTFEEISNAFCRLVDVATDQELANFTLRGGLPFTGMVMAAVHRASGEWVLEAVGAGISAKHPSEAAQQVAAMLAAP
ncbi:TerD family protein [Skermania piniformis]|uniref:TerD family protein n=1 Tax=Skermania pinensis TaxID=39122 RepID=UPI000829C37E|nr:TerD family protein [Skermania piniformis]